MTSTRRVGSVSYSPRQTPMLATLIAELKLVYKAQEGQLAQDEDEDDMVSVAAQLAYLHLELPSDEEAAESGTTWSHEVRATPLFSGSVLEAANRYSDGIKESVNMFPQYAMLASIRKVMGRKGITADGVRHLESLGDSDKRLFLNTDAPLSAFICGLQGSGKSHTMACLLENFLLSKPILGRMPNPLKGIVFHYDKYTSVSTRRPCEASSLASHLPVVVYVSPSNFTRMKQVYAGGDTDPKPIVRKLKIRREDLNAQRMMAMMVVDQSTENPPLYLQYVVKILREMACVQKPGKEFDYRQFKDLLLGTDLTAQQKGPLNLRLQILESFLYGEQEPQPEPLQLYHGTLAIIDMSDPFVDERTACALFNVCLGIFLERETGEGLVIALDEAHKYLGVDAPSKEFTETLLQVVRQQRHLAARVLISTQEPTISPELLALCNICIVHRFESPSWLKYLQQHIAAVSTYRSSAEDDDILPAQELLQQVISLSEGEAFIFNSQGLISASDAGERDGEEEEGSTVILARKLGDKFLKVKMRPRITHDGGQSLFASDRQHSGERV